MFFSFKYVLIFYYLNLTSIGLEASGPCSYLGFANCSMITLHCLLLNLLGQENSITQISLLASLIH